MASCRRSGIRSDILSSKTMSRSSALCLDSPSTCSCGGPYRPVAGGVPSEEVDLCSGDPSATGHRHCEAVTQDPTPCRPVCCGGCSVWPASCRGGCLNSSATGRATRCQQTRSVPMCNGPSFLNTPSLIQRMRACLCSGSRALERRARREEDRRSGPEQSSKTGGVGIVERRGESSAPRHPSLDALRLLFTAMPVLPTVPALLHGKCQSRPLGLRIEYCRRRCRYFNVRCN